MYSTNSCSGVPKGIISVDHPSGTDDCEPEILTGCNKLKRLSVRYLNSGVLFRLNRPLVRLTRMAYMTRLRAISYKDIGG